LGFHTLRVINDDKVAAGRGFAPHGHRDMEIITYMLDGTLEHRDSMGHHGVIPQGSVQRMSAGRGIRHSEFNNSQEEPCHFLQIWIQPNAKGLEPEYEQRDLDPEREGLQIFASPDGREGSMTIHQDAVISSLKLPAGEEWSLEVEEGRALWLQLLSGQVSVQREDSERLSAAAGDGVATRTAGTVSLNSTTDAELLVFDLNTAS
jgi:hypothetical protein